MIELISTITILAAIGSVASGVILTAADGYFDANTTAQIHNELTVGLERITRELKTIVLDPIAGGVAPDIDAVNTTSITWESNSNLSLTGSNIMLSIAGSSPAVLLSNVSSLNIQTFDESNAALPTPIAGPACDAIRRIAVTVSIVRHGVSDSLTTRVFVRSTMSGAGG